MSRGRRDHGPGPVARAVLGVALASLPRRFRRHYGEEIRASFHEGHRDAGSWARRIRFIVRSTVGVLKTAVAERMRPTMAHANEREDGMKLGAWVGTLLADVRLALRGMRRKPLFALVVVATLG
ncbi:MAG: hypothetical protein HKN73_17695, partial [Gemmatimonadetes bacterium]|nr:hypothetical protein [Gemmatimonadota bacterium]